MKLTIEAIRVLQNMTRSEFADKLGITADRYNRLASGESKMLATEMITLHDVTGIDWDMIDPVPNR